MISRLRARRLFLITAFTATAIQMRFKVVEGSAPWALFETASPAAPAMFSP